MSIPVGYARRNDAGHVNSGRSDFILLVHRVMLLGIRVVAKNQSQFVIHRTFDFDEQRPQGELNALHNRNVVLDGQIRETRMMAAF